MTDQTEWMAIVIIQWALRYFFCFAMQWSTYCFDFRLQRDLGYSQCAEIAG